jgi:phage regulator Rha-like protein
MTNLIIDNKKTMSSREIANLTGKRHDNVMTVIKDMIDKGILLASNQGEYKDSTGRNLICYNLDKRDSLVIVARLSPEFTAVVIDRWQELESQQIDSYLISNPIERAKKWIKEQEKKQELLEQQSKLVIENMQLFEQKEKISKEQKILLGKMTTDNMRDSLRHLMQNAPGARIPDRWRHLYKEFKLLYSIDIPTRFNNYDKYQNGKLGSILCNNRIDYADKILKVIPELYNLAMKLFATDFGSEITRIANLTTDCPKYTPAPK